jgi:serine/threonine-protein kinase
MELRPGQRVTPSLELVRQLGAGGMGTVWVARNHGLKSDVVVKFITGENAQHADVVARFEREARAAAEVRSPHVVQVFDHGVALDGLPYIVMELLEGEDLAARVAREHAMSPGAVAGVLVQVARALGRAHEKRIVHRDIKPENIFLCDTGEDEAFVKVLDFGVAKMLTVEQLGGTATGAMLGTPYYMSPEQVAGAKSIDYRTDLWSLGVVAFYAMTGARPFEADTMGGLVIQIHSGPIPSPSTVNPRLSPAIDAWFATACARDPSQRFQTARAMADALVAAVGGQAVARVPAKALSASGQEDRTELWLPAMSASPPPPAPPPTHVQTQRPLTGLASTTGPASVGESRVSVVSARRRRWVFPLALAGVALVIIVPAILFVITRGGSPASVAPAASEREPVVEAKTTAAASVTKQETAATEATSASVAPTVSAAAAASRVVAAPVAPRASAKPSVPTTVTATARTSGSATSAPTATAKPKRKDEVLE